MADNVGYTPGVGEVIATDDVAGVQHQRVKISLGSDGVDDGMVSSSNPMPVTATGTVNVSGNFLTDTQLRAAPLLVDGSGELIESLEATRMGVQSMLRSIGGASLDTAGRLRTVAERVETIAGGTITTVTTVTTVSTVTTVTTLANQTSIGTFSATEQIPVLMRLGADCLRRNISVT